MIRIGTGVDDIADRLRRDALDRRQHRIGLRTRTRIDDDNAVFANLHADVSTCAGNHVEIWTDLEHLQVLRLPNRGRLAQRDKCGEQKDESHARHRARS